MGHRLIVKCKRCGAEITYKLRTENPVPKNVTGETPRPVMLRQSLECSLCKSNAEYTRQDLQFRSA